MKSGYQELIAWQRAMDLAKAVYAATRDFPREEMYGLTSQLRRCAVSIPSNIAEGHGRGAKKAFHQFLAIARGSLFELETQLLLAAELDLLSAPKAKELQTQIAETARVLNGLFKSMEN
jgi:four helix bundle protein